MKVSADRSGQAKRPPLRRLHAGVRPAASALAVPTRSAHSLLLALLMLAAFLGQSIVTQSHIHFAGSAAPAVAVAEGSFKAPPLSKRGPADSPADCPVCRELAAAGHYLLPDLVTLPGAVLPLVWVFVPPLLGIACPQRSHRWQSRAPPQ